MPLAKFNAKTSQIKSIMSPSLCSVCAFFVDHVSNFLFRFNVKMKIISKWLRFKWIWQYKNKLHFTANVCSTRPLICKCILCMGWCWCVSVFVITKRLKLPVGWLVSWSFCWFQPQWRVLSNASQTCIVYVQCILSLYCIYCGSIARFTIGAPNWNPLVFCLPDARYESGSFSIKSQIKFKYMPNIHHRMMCLLCWFRVWIIYTRTHPRARAPNIIESHTDGG